MFDWITGLVERSGYPGIALLMLAENLFPPIPSEVVMPLAGFAAARGELALVPVVLAGSAGSLAGALFWYLVGRWVGAERLKRWTARHGRWLTLSPGEVDKACAWFGRHGTVAVLAGRLVPAVRTLVSVPAGIAGMDLPRFLAWSAIGTLLWTGLLAAAGHALEDRHGEVAGWLNPASNAVLALLLLGYLYRVATFRPDDGRGSGDGNGGGGDSGAAATAGTDDGGRARIGAPADGRTGTRGRHRRS